MNRRLGWLVLAVFLSACAAPVDENRPQAELGDFRLGHNIVVGSTARPVGPTREATPEEWEAVLTAEIDRRLGTLNGEKLYHLGVSVDGYALALPGIPVALNPRSTLVISVTAWDNATQTKLNPEPHQIVVFEAASRETFIGSGLTQTRGEQMANLARNAVYEIEGWLMENRVWFGLPATVPPDA